MKIDHKKYPFPSVRHHLSAHNYLRIEELKNVPESYPKLINNINYCELFANGKAPKVLDIGCGKGIFLLNYAEQNPNQNILGIEIREPLVNWINHFIKEENIVNAAAVRYSVVNRLPFIESNSIHKVFYLFPDPWPKRIHRRRRAFTIDFLEEIYRILEVGGSLNLATDVPEVNEYHKELLELFGKFDFRMAEDTDWNYPITNKESFCIRHNIDTYKIIAIK